GVDTVPQEEQQVGDRAADGDVALGVNALDGRAPGPEGDEPFAAAEPVEVRVGGVQVDRLAVVTELSGPPHGQHDGEHLVDGVDRELGADRGGGTDGGLGV